jgi:serine phosphatase RsbU (regulator of sigma subunit)
VLRRASDALDHQLEDNEFVTAAFGVLDTRTGRARVSLFGHPGPLLAGKEDVVAPEDIRCPPLGVPIAAACPPWELTLETGDTLVLYTDGVLESRAGSEFFGSERLRSAISRAAGSPTAQGVADAALDAVRDFAEGKLSDDIAILALRYLGPAAVGEM